MSALIPLQFLNIISPYYCTIDPTTMQYNVQNLVLQPFNQNKDLCPINPNKDTIFRAYTSTNPDTPTILRTGDVAALQQSGITNSKCLVVYLHGFMASPDSPNSQNFKNAILNSAGCNVILVDNKGLLSAPDYFTAIGNIKPIAEFTATFLDDLISKVGQMPLFLVGTSIGGHIAGVTSRKMTGTVSIAYGLDVAGPILDFLPEDSTIAKGDAKFVVLVHSNMFFFGSFRLAGDLDIFVNNGIIQLNCFIAFITTPTTPLPKVVLCSHLTSVAMMTKGMSNPTRYPMTKCSSFAEPIMGPCAVPSSVYFADYFIENSPLLGESGIRRIDTTDTTLSA